MDNLRPTRFRDRYQQCGEFSLRNTFLQLFITIGDSFKNVRLRRVFIESMGFEGYYKTSKDYLQPILKSLAIGLPFLAMLSDRKRTAVIVAGLYFILYLLSSLASRYSYRLSDFKKGEEGAAMFIWKVDILIFLSLILLLWYKLYFLSALAFTALFVLQNFWRPVLISRVDKTSDSKMGATVLSIESQAKSFFTMICAPLLGLCVDQLGFWPVGLFGFLIALFMIMSGKRKR